MAVPFRKVSKTRKRMRQANKGLETVTTTTCPNCGATIKPHRVCEACGYYKGKKVTKEENAE